jgi:hypothetical protein
MIRYGIMAYRVACCWDGCDLSSAPKPRESHAHFRGEDHEVGFLYLEEVS